MESTASFVAELRGRIPSGHPRLFTRPEELERLRDKRNRSQEARAIWEEIERLAREALRFPLPDEPPTAFPDGQFDVVAWRKGIYATEDILQALHSLGFAFLMTENEEYGEAGKRLLLHVTKWDPLGTSGRQINDEISMRLLYGLSRAYDWLHPLLSPAEAKQVQECMRVRGEDVYQIMRKIKFEEHLRDNHLTRSMGFLGEAAMAFLGDFPEAEVWFDYIVTLFIDKYPPWGGEEGGWSQGVGYWQAYISWALEFLDALKIATGYDLYQKPFFRNTGYFKLYAHPPKSKFSAFGDHSDLPPNYSSAYVMSHLAGATGNSAFQWYAAQVPGITKTPVLSKNSFIGYVRAPEPGQPAVPAQLPPGFPQSRYFSDIGWVLMNVDMEDWDHNVHVKFKSSPYGSHNHGHAEQNSFMLEAYGSPLAISSGYYPWYGSPHHRTWSWQSKSKNTILVNGEGQEPQDITAKGIILATHFGSMFDYTAGDATPAYKGKLDRFIRHLWFLKPNLIVIYDELEAKEGSTYQWLLHADREMELYEPERRVRVVAETADMWVTFVHPHKLMFSQTDQFTVPPEDREAHKPNQWHFTAHVASEKGRGRFLTLLNPRPAADADRPPLPVETLAVANGYGAKVAWREREYVILFRDSLAAGPAAWEGERVDGLAAAWWQGAEGKGVLLLNARSAEQDGTVQVRSVDGPVTCGIEWRRDGGGLSVHLQVAKESAAALAITCEDKPVRVVINGEELAASGWRYEDGILRIL